MHPEGQHGWTFKEYRKLNRSQIQNSSPSDQNYDDGLFSAQDDPSDENMDESTDYVTCREFYAYRLQIRPFSVSDRRCYFLMFGRLLQQYMVDQYAKIEGERLRWYANNQDELLVANYQGLSDALLATDGDMTVSNIARPIILPSSFTCGPRHMNQQFQDAMGIVRRYGKPDLFITFTCNPKWPEITDNLIGNQTTSDRPDLTARVFKIKLMALLNDLFVMNIFGKQVAYTWVVEFQKRGLPHAHILLILESEYKIKQIADIDNIVCAEIPNEADCPLTFATITSSMIHGPCGDLNPKAPCMINGKCSKNFPRGLSQETTIKDDGYPDYRRRPGMTFTNRRGIVIDNSWVVPYNPWLATKYDAHINVEICSSVAAVKYLYKYIHKGYDKARATVASDDNTRNEIKEFVDSRFVSASESMWRIFRFKMHGQFPSIFRLQVHVEGQHLVITLCNLFI